MNGLTRIMRRGGICGKPQIRKLKSRIVISVALAVLASPRDIRADVVTDWNEITLATQAATPGGIRTPPAARALAMVHLAIFDSVNAIDRHFTPYLVKPLADPDASPEAAAVAAAHAVLVALYPSLVANLDQAYDDSLATIPDGQAKDDGIDVGESVAAAILALRSADGSDVTLPYTVPPGPGIYQPDPGGALCGLGQCDPVRLDRAAPNSGPRGPRRLPSAKYAADYLRSAERGRPQQSHAHP